MSAIDISAPADSSRLIFKIESGAAKPKELQMTARVTEGSRSSQGRSRKPSDLAVPKRRRNIDWTKVEIEWREMTETTNGRPEVVFIKGHMTQRGFEYFDRRKGEASWFPVSSQFRPHCVKKTKEILDVTSVPGANCNAPTQAEIGDVYDNIEAFSLGVQKMNIGALDEALRILKPLRDHLVSSPDPKNRGLLERVEGTLLQISERIMAKGTSTAGVAGDSLHIPQIKSQPFKVRLLEAMVLVSTCNVALNMTVHEVMRLLPGLVEWPTAANVVAGSALTIAVFVVRTRSG
jgi:hypothetical protein